jgi:hypothetical protein
MSQKITVTNYFGGCPKCGRSDGLYNVSKEHWFVCHTHKVRWTIGSNIFSSRGPMKLDSTARAAELTA